MVERLQEVVVTSSEHLRQLLAECEGEGIRAWPAMLCVLPGCGCCLLSSEAACWRLQ